jgi:hypothetical protein
MIRPLTYAAVLGLALVAVLAGCDTPATRPSYPDIRFTELPKLRLDVAGIDVQVEFHPTFQPPDVEHLFPVTPQRAAENWARDRLEATGTTRRARVRIIDASVKESELPRTQGLTGTFTRDQAQRYDAVIEMTIDILGDRGFAERTVSAKTTRTQSVAEGITPNERDQVWYNMTKQLLNDENQELERQMRANFGYYLQ